MSDSARCRRPALLFPQSSGQRKEFSDDSGGTWLRGRIHRVPVRVSSFSLVQVPQIPHGSPRIHSSLLPRRRIARPIDISISILFRLPPSCLHYCCQTRRKKVEVLVLHIELLFYPFLRSPATKVVEASTPTIRPTSAYTRVHMAFGCIARLSNRSWKTLFHLSVALNFLISAVPLLSQTGTMAPDARPFTALEGSDISDFYRNYGYPFIDPPHGGTFKGVVAALDALTNLAGPNTKLIPGHGTTISKPISLRTER